MNRNLVIGCGGVFWSLLMLCAILPLGVAMPDSVEIAALSPVFWPRIIVVLAGISSVVLLGQGVRQLKQDRIQQAANTEYYVWHIALRRVSIVFALVFGIYFLVEYMGLVISSIFTLAVLMKFAGEKNLFKIFAISLSLPLILFLFFQYVASVPIPLGEIVYLILPE